MEKLELLKLKGDEDLKKHLEVEKEGDVNIYLYEGKRYSGIVEIYYEEDILRVEGELKEGKKIGTWKEYHKNGSILGEERYQNGMVEGEYIQYYDNGEREMVGTYHLDKKVGVWTEFKEINGEKTITKVPYENGMVNGTVNTYLEEGTILHRAEYKDDNMLKLTLFDTNGNKKWVAINEEGGEISIREEYKRGKLISVKRYKNEELDGLQESYEDIFGKVHDIPLKKEYYKDGSLVKSEHYTAKGELYYKIEVSEDGEATVQRLI